MTYQVMERADDAVYRCRMDTQAYPFGGMLRRWRLRRRMTQLDLALAANTSMRHLSCLETGKSRPSREMILRLAEPLELPLRVRNEMLLSAEFAPIFQECPINQLGAATTAMTRILQAHSPYPAFVVDRHWNVVLSNSALPQLYEGCADKLLARPVNAMRLTLHPEGMGPRILNYSMWRDHSITLLRQQIRISDDPVLQSLLTEIIGYKNPTAEPGTDHLTPPDRLATPLRVATRLGDVSFLNAVTVFGTANDLTLSELALEMLFPADELTVRIVSEMTAETVSHRHLSEEETLSR